MVWTDREVAQRWTRFFTGPVIIQRYLQEESLTAAEQAQVQATLNLWRARLADWSWFMPCLNQSLARQANAEDGCTGRFWEGRFKSQALFNAGALLTAMTYVDLNPIRAQLAESLATSEFTSVQQRMQTPEMSPAQGPRAAWPRLLPFAGHAEDIDALPFRWRDYLEPAASTGRCAVPGK
ncbi:MAG: hypothetical protein IT494_05280 [Gammaproteobacteria bacterium]|nr:hypothetical protein [Gammaproteobacteria bacterium]